MRFSRIRKAKLRDGALLIITFAKINPSPLMGEVLDEDENSKIRHAMAGRYIKRAQFIVPLRIRYSFVGAWQAKPSDY